MTIHLTCAPRRVAREVSVFSPRWHVLLTVTLLGASLSFASGCATGAQTRHGIPAGQWQARLPTTRSPIDELAFGRGGSGTPAAPDELASLAAPAPDEVLQPMAAAKTVAVAKPNLRRAPLAAATTAPAPAVPAAEPAQVTPEAAPASAPLLAQNDAPVESRYAQREADSRDQQKFRGGDAIVISAGALVVVLLIVILVLLLR